MKTVMVHNRLGCYDMLHPSNKSESYYLCFDSGDKEHTTIVFSYNEEDAPLIQTDGMTPDELLDELECNPSVRCLFASSYNHIEEKSHAERICLGRKLAKTNRRDDLLTKADYLIRKQDYHRDRLASLANQIAGVQEEIKLLAQ